MNSPRLFQALILFQLLTTIAIVAAQPIRVAGTLDSSFNPFGLWITATGASVTGGYPGSIIIDLGEEDRGGSVATFQSDGERIIIGGISTSGPGNSVNFALVILTQTGALDSSFNPSGLWITATGAAVTGGYPGSIIIDLGGFDFGESVAIFQSDGERIIIGGSTTTGPGDPFNFALVVLTETGALDSSFNPSGFWIDSNGLSIPGGYPGSITIDLGGSDRGRSVATFQSDGERIIIGGDTNTGPGDPDNFALVVLTRTGVLDSSFNSSGLWITATGASVTGGYPGSIIVDLGGDEDRSVATFQSDGERIIIGGTTNAGPGDPDNFALVVLTQTGVLDSSFNPSGFWIDSNGASVPGGYPGSIIIDLGDDDEGNPVATFQSEGGRIIIGGATTTGPGDPSNFALVVLTQTGALDNSFNPSGLWIDSNGLSIPGGYPGSIIIDLGRFDIGRSVATFQSDGERIIIGGDAIAGPGVTTNFALLILTEAGVLDSSFNPLGLWITETGASVTGGYPGSIIIDLGGSDRGETVATFQSNGERIILGGGTNAGPGAPFNNFALVVLNGETIFPPPTTGVADPFLQALIRKYSGICPPAVLG